MSADSSLQNFPIEDVLAKIDRLLDRNPRAQCYLKWTCPGCGERVTATKPNTYCIQGYVHEERGDGTPCGVLYTGTRFNFVYIAGAR